MLIRAWRARRKASEGLPATVPEEIETMKRDELPEGWDEDRVRRVLLHYEEQAEDEALAEDEAAWEARSATFIEVPNALLPRIRELLAKTAG